MRLNSTAPKLPWTSPSVAINSRSRRTVVGPLEADAPARPAGFGRTRIADEDELRIEVEAVQRQRGLQAVNGCASHAELDAFGAHERVHLVDRQAGLRIGRDRRAARVIAVKAAAGVDVELGLAPRPEDEAELGVRDARAARSAVRRVVAADLESIRVGTQADRAAQPRRPACRVVDVQAKAGLDDMVAPCRR